MSKPIESLLSEHRIIDKVLVAIAVAVDKIKSGEEIDKLLIEKIHEFMLVFADKCHHGKEENHLFTYLRKTGVPIKGCPIDILISEHQKARILVKQLSDSFDSHSALSALQGIIDLYPGHIWKEDHLLFPMSKKILTTQQIIELDDIFKKVEREIGPDIHTRYISLANEINTFFT